jgi:MFS transporter, FHS family, glucose/mannose:H+ symporter
MAKVASRAALMPQPETISAQSARAITIAAHAAFVPTGIVTVLLGPLLPILATRWVLNDVQSGYLFTAQFTGAMIGTLGSGWLVSRVGYRPPIVAGLLMMAIGTVGLSAGPWLLGIACVACNGLGYGLAVPASNISVAEANPTRRAGALNLLNFSWSAGSVACPFLISAFARVHAVPTFLLATGAAVVLIALAIARLPYPHRESKTTLTSAPDQASFWMNPFVSILGLLFFLYVGTETCLGGWIASFAKRLGAGSVSLSVMTPSFFYGALLLGRGLAPIVLRTVSELALARLGLALASFGVLDLMLAHSLPAVIVGAALGGLGLSAVYPITISMLTHKFGPRATSLASLMFSLANLGGASMPWLVGYSSVQFSSLRAGLAVPFLGAVGMLALYLVNWRLVPDEAKPRVAV